MKALLIAVIFAAMTGCFSTNNFVVGKRVDVSLAKQMANFWEDDRLVARLPIVSGAGISPETTTYPGNIASTKRTAAREKLLPASWFATS